MASIRDFAPTSYRAGALVVVLGTGAMTATGAAAGLVVGSVHPVLPALLFGAPAFVFFMLVVFERIMEERIEWRKSLAQKPVQPYVQELPPDQPRWSHYRATGKEPENRFDSRVHVDSRSLVQPALPVFVTPEQMVKYAHGILYEYCDLSHDVWAHTDSRFKTFSQPKYARLQGFLRGWALIAEVNGSKNNGYELTTAGRVWLESILAAYRPALLKK